MVPSCGHSRRVPVADLDPVARYARSFGFSIAPKTIIVEGRTDFDLFTLAARYEERETHALLLDCDMAVMHGGDGDEGGTAGVIRQLITLRNIARTDLGPKGTPRYRFVALFDADRAGHQALSAAHALDRSIIEFKDVFLLRPIMPMVSHADPRVLERHFHEANAEYRNIDWELEDLLGAQLVSAFCEEYPNAVSRECRAGNVVHRDFTRDGKARLHRFTKDHAICRDLANVTGVLRAFRRYFGLDENGNVDLASKRNTSSKSAF